MVVYLPTILMNTINQATNYIPTSDKYELIYTINSNCRPIYSFKWNEFIPIWSEFIPEKNFILKVMTKVPHINPLMRLEWFPYQIPI